LDYSAAREAPTIYEARNIRSEDFDLDKKKADHPKPERLTVAVHADVS
jgi:hypothetical protein